MNNISKKVYNNSTTLTETQYLAGYQYISNVLQFFPTAEGYINNTVVSGINQYSYVYNYTDHLGNIRLSYKKNGTTLQILEENNYYPFGLKHTHYNTTNAQPNYKYKYNGKEYQDELGLNFYDYGARNYDASIGRWMNVDILQEKYESITPYNYCAGNPVRFLDVNGEWIYIEGEDDNRKYRYQNGQTQYQNDVGDWVNVDESITVSDYAISVIASLETLKQSGKTGEGLINYFSNDENNVLVTQAYSNFELQNIIGFDFNNDNKTVTTAGYIDTPAYIALGHELAHSEQPALYEYKDFTSDLLGSLYGSAGTKWFNNSFGEIYASHIENKIRAESGQPLRVSYRTFYSNKLLGTPQYYDAVSTLIDKNGNSLYYNKEGTFIEASIMEIINARDSFRTDVIGGEIINNRYNYLRK